MNADALALLGWTGQACFFGRFVVQWIASERSGRCVAPSAFWWLSLAGTSLVGAFSWLRGDLLLLPGFAVGTLIYARNLRLARAPAARPSAGRLWPIAVTAGLALVPGALLQGGARSGETWAWLIVAALGQVLWVARFLVQWIASERAGTSRLPAAFWWTSLGGNLLLLAYAFHLREPVYVAGFLLGPLLQARNLMILRGELRRVAVPGRID